jgi:subtilase family serine protease
VYGFPTSTRAGRGQTIAIVVAFHDVNAERNLRKFSRTFDLPLCTKDNGCFRQVDQAGGTNYTTTDEGWALEADLDVQWAHAIAPGAKIVLVEANDNILNNMLHAEDTASQLGRYVSNSWGSSTGESSFEFLFDHHFYDVPGESYFFGSGDLPQAYYPSTSPYVVSVGGTSLFVDDGRFKKETAWSSAGGGCSAYEPASAAQLSFAQYAQVGCNGYRATPDVSLDADPATGVSVYTTQGGQTGWWIIGGTSASTPMIAARSAITGALVNQAFIYGNSIGFRDITVGSNFPCLVGYDLCSGRGSWLDNNND